MLSVAEEQVDAGVLDRRALDHYVFPVYARSVAEARAPLEREPDLAAAFEVQEISTTPVPSPYEAQLAGGATPAAYASAYATFVRAFSESALVRGLFEPGARGVTAAELTDRFFARLEERMRAEPGAHAFEDWTLTVWLRRKAG